MQFDLEARVGIEPNQVLNQKSRRVSDVPARTQVTKLTLLTLGESQVFTLQSRLGINRLKLQKYSRTTRLKLRCWQFCWQSNTQSFRMCFNQRPRPCDGRPEQIQYERVNRVKCRPTGNRTKANNASKKSKPIEFDLGELVLAFEVKMADNLDQMNKSEGMESAVSPLATGGAGVYFEQHVGAAFLSLLLVRGIPPCLPHCQLSEVHFQTRHRGWHTDDLLLVGRGANDKQVQLAAQVKRSFTISHKDEDFRKTIGAAWHDYMARALFNSETDAFGIITLRGSDTMLKHFATLLDCARFSVDAADFASRLDAPGLIDKKARHYCEEVRVVVEEAARVAVSDEEFVGFLRRLYLLTFDLNTATAQTEAWVKTLLAHTATGPDKIGAAAVTWNELLAIAGAGEPQAATFTYETLPESVRLRHAPVTSQDHHWLKVLAEHSQPVQRGASNRIGGKLQLPRKSLVLEILAELEEHRVIIVTGPAGSGKSVLAGEVFGSLIREMPAFAFRAEEFARAHLDETLHAAQIQLTANRLSALLALEPRKLFWVESLERLLERTNRAALMDLLNLVQTDESCRLVITCRDYSVNLVCSSLLEQAGLAHRVVNVPLLSDEELAVVWQEFPQLEEVSRNPSLSELLRNPYILDKASRMQWRPGATLPENERSFRLKVWQEIIREDDKTEEAMPRRRGDVFVEVALRRARALSAYADCADLDQHALQRLHQSGLIEFSPESDSLAAPSHDVLEDWALLHWLNELFARKKTTPDAFFVEMGSHPALRRGYRRWLEELLERVPEEADRWIADIIESKQLSQQSRDDTLVVVLSSVKSKEFLERNETLLLANDGNLLRRVIHLLRVGCKAPTGVPLGKYRWMQYLPKYPVWSVVLRIVNRNLDKIATDYFSLILGLLEDWCTGVGWANPYPPGFEDVANTAFSLLSLSDDWRISAMDGTKRLLKVIARIPKGAPAQFEKLLQRGIAHDREKRWVNDFAEIILEHLDGGPACRDFPDLVIALAESQWGISAEAGRRFNSGDHFDVEVAFGLSETLTLDFFPPSAYHGPFSFLLTQHPQLGVEFILRLLNHGASFYADPTVFHRYIELPSKISFELPNGSRHEQWCSPRLWFMYRAASVGPSLLESALMALERWLLDLCQMDEDTAEICMTELMTKSNNVAITAVVASAAIAYPGAAGSAGLSLLTCADFIELERARMSHGSVPTGLFGDLPDQNVEDAMFKRERKESNALEHRRLDLENLAIQLQTGPHRARVWKILDHYRSELPAVEQQTEEQKLWRLALHRMDIRQWERKGQTADGKEIIGSKTPEADIQSLLAKHAPEQEDFNERLALLAWGMAIFQHNHDAKADREEWVTRLAQAKKVYERLASDDHSSDRIQTRLGSAGTAYVAAVVIRDRWMELSGEDRDWCVKVVIDSILEDADSKDQFFIAGRNAMEASRPAAFVVSALFGRGLEPEREMEILDALAMALSHASEEAASMAFMGVGAFLWKADRSLALTCVGAVVREGKIGAVIEASENAMPYAQRTDRDGIESERTAVFRNFIRNREKLLEDAFAELDFSSWAGRRAMRDLLPIFGPCEDQIAVGFFNLVSRTLASWWKKSPDRQRDTDRHHELEHLCAQRLASFLLTLPVQVALDIVKPIFDLVGENPKEVGGFVELLIGVEDVVGSGETFWTLWQQVADRVAQAPWVGSLGDRSFDKVALINALFLGVHWNEGVHHWQRLAGEAARLDGLFKVLPPSPQVINEYCRFLFSVGQRSLPKALLLIADKLKKTPTGTVLLIPEVIFFLEVIMRRWVYSQPGELKANLESREAVLLILDALVEAGSSHAYRMRDDFVSPSDGSNQQ
jgi:hypothetical protein